LKFIKKIKKKSSGYGYGYWFDVNRRGNFWKFSKFMKRYNDLLNHYNVSANRYNDSETVQRVRGYEGASTGVWAASTTGFFQKKKTDRPFSNPDPFTRLYSGTGTDCTRRILANLEHDMTWYEFRHDTDNISRHKI
jgi:hypothetical protein